MNAHRSYCYGRAHEAVTRARGYAKEIGRHPEMRQTLENKIRIAMSSAHMWRQIAWSIQ